MRYLILSCCFLYFGIAAFSQSNLEVTVAFHTKKDSEGFAQMAIVEKKTQMVMDKQYKNIEAEVEIFLNEKSTGILESEGNKLYIGDLAPGEKLVVRNLKVLDMASLAHIYLTGMELDISKALN